MYKIKTDCESNNYILNSWIATLVIMFGFINGVIGVNGISVINISIILFLCFFSYINSSFRIYKIQISTILVLLILFGISMLRMTDSQYTLRYLMYFIAFCCPAFLVGVQTVNIKNIISNCILLGLAGLAVLWVRGVENSNTGYEMGMSYSVLITVFTSAIGLIIHSKYRIVAILNIICATILLVPIAPRGFWVSLLIFLSFLLYYLLIKNASKKTAFIWKSIVLLIAVVITVIIINNLSEILLWLNSKLTEVFNIKVYALQKYAHYLKKDNVLNGRDRIWEIALGIIKKDVIFGKGIGYFETVTQGSHVHNIFLQSLCENGILFLIPLAFIILKSVFKILSYSDKQGKEEYLYFVMLFVYGVVMLFYSSVYWMWPQFWYFLGYYLNIRKSKAD